LPHAKGSCLTPGDGEGGGAKREDYTEEDVEYYFNYSGILAERGSYDTLEDLIKCELHLDLVVIGLLYMAYPDGCRHKIFIPAEAKALPREGASALVCELHIPEH